MRYDMTHEERVRGARHGGQACLAKHGHAHCTAMGVKGGSSNLQKKGREYFQRIARIRWDKARNGGTL